VLEQKCLSVSMPRGDYPVDRSISKPSAEARAAFDTREDEYACYIEGCGLQVRGWVSGRGRRFAEDDASSFAMRGQKMHFAGIADRDLADLGRAWNINRAA